MVAGGGKDRVQVDGRDAEVAQVIQFLGHAVQVAAFETVDGGRRIPAFKRQVGRWIALALGETVGEDLVEDGVLYPVGGGHMGLYSRVVSRADSGLWHQ